MLFVVGKMLWFLCFVFSDDLKWEFGYYVYDNETELIYVKKGVVRFIIDFLLYVVYVDDIVVIECGRLHVVVFDVNDLVMMCICVLYGFQFQGVEENYLL